MDEHDVVGVLLGLEVLIAIGQRIAAFGNHIVERNFFVALLPFGMIEAAAGEKLETGTGEFLADFVVVAAFDVVSEESGRGSVVDRRGGHHTDAVAGFVNLIGDAFLLGGGIGGDA